MNLYTEAPWWEKTENKLVFLPWGFTAIDKTCKIYNYEWFPAKKTKNNEIQLVSFSSFYVAYFLV